MAGVSLAGNPLIALYEPGVSYPGVWIDDYWAWLMGTATPFASINYDFVADSYNYAATIYPNFAALIAGGTRGTFSRASVGEYTDAAGALTSVAVDTLRRGSLGALIEPAGTNIVLQSSDPSNVVWVNFANGTGTISQSGNSVVAPDGTTTADAVTIDRSINSSYAQKNQTFTGTAVTYTGSLWLKAHGAGDVGKQVSLSLYNGTTLFPILITLTSTWVRYTNSHLLVASAGCQIVVGYVPNAIGGGIQNGQVIFDVWGGQAEIGAAATSYIVTAAVSATRAADAMAIVLPSGTHTLTYTFDDSSTQVVAGQTGTYNVPTNLSRANIKSLVGVRTGP